MEICVMTKPVMVIVITMIVMVLKVKNARE